MSNQNILGSWISKLANEILYSQVSTKGDYVNVHPKHIRVMNFQPKYIRVMAKSITLLFIFPIISNNLSPSYYSFI